MYFIDRDPTHFGAVLEYLRTGEITTDYLYYNEEKIKKLEKEFDYYQLGVRVRQKHSKLTTCTLMLIGL